MLALSDIPKVDIHRHAETYAHLDRLRASSSNQSPYNWEDWLKRLAELPAGMPRLERLNGDLARDGLDALAMDDEVFYMWVSAMLEEAARGGAVLVEIRFGVGDGLLADRMHVFRESERRIREHHPYFCAEAIGVVNIGTENAADAFEVCLRARDKGLAGIDIIPSPYEFETDWTAAFEWAECADDAGLGISVHAGEFSEANLAAALRLPGVSRIGHAVHAAASEELMKQIADSGVTVECCLSSNLVLGAVSSLDDHPIHAFVREGVPVTLGTDDPVRLCTSIGREYEQATALGFVIDDLMAFTRQGISSSFTSEEKKSALLGYLDYVEVAGSHEE